MNAESLAFAESYDIDTHGLITDRGKFEREPRYVPYFYDAMLNGDGETVYPSCDCGENCECSPDYTEFSIADDERALWPDLQGYNAIRLTVSETGFVYHSLTK